MDTCSDLPRHAFPARYMVPAKETDPVLSAILVTVIPLVASRAARLPCLGGPTSWPGLRRCGCEATSTSRWKICTRLSATTASTGSPANTTGTR